MKSTRCLFRSAAVHAAAQRWFAPVLIVTPPATAAVVFIALAAVACLILATIVIEIPERVHASGVLLPKEGLLKIRVRRAGWVDALDVSNGTPVVKGQPLLWLTNDERAPERMPESSRRLSSLQNELSLLDQSTAQELAAVEARRSGDLRRIDLLGQRIEATKTEHQTRKLESALQDDRARRTGELAEQGLLAMQQADDIAAAALRAHAASDGSWQRVLALQDELLLLRQRVAAEAEQGNLLHTRAMMRREALLRDIAAVELRFSTEVRAPDSGVVSGLAVRRGSFVQPGHVIMTLHDPNDPVEARLYVSAGNATMISIGQRVELQLRAYPHQLFGTQGAVITSVSPVALPAQEFDVAIDMPGPVFEIRATLESSHIIARGRAWRLPPGTEFSAELIRRRWPLYRWLLRREDSREEARA